MLEFIKRFWVSLSIKNWTFENRRLANPVTIIRRLVFLPIVFITKWIYLFAILCGWGIDEMQNAKDSY
jgi:hypothetical protein